MWLLRPWRGGGVVSNLQPQGASGLGFEALGLAAGFRVLGVAVWVFGCSWKGSSGLTCED